MPAPIVVLEELPRLLAPNARVIGIDLGEKTIGLALSDTRRTIASPLETLKRTQFRRDAERLLALARLHDVGGFIIGLPRNMDGSEGPRAQATRCCVRSWWTIRAAYSLSYPSGKSIDLVVFNLTSR